MQVNYSYAESRHLPDEMAKIFFDRYIAIRKRSIGKIREALAGDPEAIRYYCGRSTTLPTGMERLSEYEDVAFLFNKTSLAPVMKRILNDEADGIILFNATRPLDEGEESNTTFRSGKPTIIMYPYKELQAEKDGKITYSYATVMGEAEEHPGTGEVCREKGMKEVKDVMREGIFIMAPSLQEPVPASI